MLFGGIFNVFGDWFFVFFLDMGVMGAGLATVLGSVFSMFLMCTHFFGKKCPLRPEKPAALFPMLKSICITGFSTFFIDVAMGILTMLFNRQILCWHGTEASSSPSARSSSAVPTASVRRRSRFCRRISGRARAGGFGSFLGMRYAPPPYSGWSGRRLQSRRPICLCGSL